MDCMAHPHNAVHIYRACLQVQATTIVGSVERHLPARPRTFKSMKDRFYHSWVVQQIRLHGIFEAVPRAGQLRDLPNHDDPRRA